eukprot:Gb_11527 [translate_table: standard]
MDGHKEVSAPSSMGIVGTIHIGDECTDLTDRVHQLPCCIKYNGQCSVSDYFKPKITGVVVDELELKQAAFRGRKLEGATLPIPQSYRGFALRHSALGTSNSPLGCFQDTACYTTGSLKGYGWIIGEKELNVNKVWVNVREFHQDLECLSRSFSNFLLSTYTQNVDQVMFPKQKISLDHQSHLIYCWQGGMGRVHRVEIYQV